MAHGNLLRKGVGYMFTFSTTIGADALRWFLSVACAYGKKIRGLDIGAAYLTADQRIPLCCFKPSHADFSGLEMEELAVSRVKLQAIVKEQGAGALKRLQRKLTKNHKERRCWESMRAVHGVPDAGNAFAMRLQGALRADCGMAQCEAGPCTWRKVVYYQEHELAGDLAHVKGSGKQIVEDWLLLRSWTDDLRHIGTDEAIGELEAAIVDPDRGT
jgi:hypothetical protein